MAKKAKDIQSTGVAQASAPPEPSEADIFAPLSVAEQVDISCFAREACKSLPGEDEVIRGCKSEVARPLIVEGTRLVRFMAGEFEQPEPDELQAAYVRFIQVDAMLTVVGGAVQGNCINDAQTIKKKCQEDCKKSKKKFCGCFWNSFLAKTDCLVDIGINVGGG
ncbi:hypothetical protein [Roseobacter sp. A03A-229]